MPSPFASIPIRANGPPNKVDASWWNSIRTALISAFGAGLVGETTFAIVNNQGAAADITGLVFDSTASRFAVIEYRIERKTTSTGATELIQGGTLMAIHRASSGWEIMQGQTIGDDAGITFSITSGGQVQYISTNITGTASISTMRFTARTLS